MATEFENTIPTWENEGEEPTSERKEKGFEPQYKPPAAYFNWFWSLVLKSLKELQLKVATKTDLETHKNDKTNIHGVTAAQVGAPDIKNRGTLISNNSDLNNLKTVGVYYSPDATVTGTLKNSPVTGKGFKMTVEQMYGAVGGHLTQRVITWNHAVYYRQFSSDAWGEWVKSYDTQNKPTAAEVDAHALSERGVLIPASSNLDDYKTAGDYFVSGANDAKTITNSPTTGSGYRLIVETGYVLGYIRQYAIGVSGNIQTRYYQQSWTPWMKIINDADLKNTIYYHSTEQLTNEDLNDIRTTGHYYAAGSNTCANSPAPSGSGFGLEVVQTAGGYFTQMCFVANVIHIRYYNGSEWGDWQEIYGSNNIPIIPITKGGTGATTAAKAIENLGLAKACKIETKTYVGTGKYGSSNKNTLTFDGVPTIIFIQPKDSTARSTFLIPQAGYYSINSHEREHYGGIITIEGKTVTWWTNSEVAMEECQLNEKNTTYFCIALTLAEDN